ncbi:hypothetical protein GFK26_10465 [Variovorax paradoxus]|uniref:REase AHJR-like domain-containing protein n=1 Tax=Variovorax paradoxus TaxID=34073 RepID=A0A5Q0M3U0_VARPD|nr:hypothetical protein [Variovorax paradoxus]QFZ83155.1 hypothetical protein GFK26_10465 [Variovorax paradoxus]
MSILTATLAERLIAKRYEKQGYVVTLEPPPSSIPFSLAGYTPDILATKGDEHILIEVKSPNARLNRDIYLSVDREVQQHPGWRFELVTVTGDELREPTVSDADRPTIGNIRQRLQVLKSLFNAPDVSGILLPQLWVAFVAALRLLADSEGISSEGLTDLSLLNKVYSQGITSIDEDATARRLLSLRNIAVHSLNPDITMEDCEELYQITHAVLERLQKSHT